LAYAHRWLHLQEDAEWQFRGWEALEEIKDGYTFGGDLSAEGFISEMR